MLRDNSDLVVLAFRQQEGGCEARNASSVQMRALTKRPLSADKTLHPYPTTTTVGMTCDGAWNFRGIDTLSKANEIVMLKKMMVRFRP